MIVADFHTEYGIWLDRTGNGELSWREFAIRVEGLMCADTRLGRCFAQSEGR